MKYGYAMIVAILLGLALGGCSKEDPKGFSKVDYNKDGKVIFEELIVVYPDLTVEEFLAADADNNGSLDAAEYQRFREARQSGKKLNAASAVPAQPAEPAKTGEPAKPAGQPSVSPAAAPAATPAPAGTPTPAATPAAAKTPAAASTPADNPAEAVETIEVGGTPQPGAATTYTVERGDTLSRIAKKFSVTPKAIIEANTLKNPDRLEAGATINIPAAVEKKAPPAGHKRR